MRGRDVDKPVVTGSASLIGAGAVPGPSGDPVRSDPVLSEAELTEIRLADVAFGDASELGFG